MARAWYWSTDPTVASCAGPETQSEQLYASKPSQGDETIRDNCPIIETKCGHGGDMWPVDESSHRLIVALNSSSDRGHISYMPIA